MPAEQVSEYEIEVIREIIRWKEPRTTLLGRLGDRAERMIEAVLSYVPLGLVDKIMGFILPRLREVTWRATSEPLVRRAYGRAGSPIEAVADIQLLDLEVVDAVAGDKRISEGTVAGAEGAVTGFAGGFTIAADIAGVILLSIRAVQSRGLVYGFDPSREEELAFVLSVLNAASRLGPESKGSARAGITAFGPRLVSNTAVEKAVQLSLERLPEKLAIRLAAMKSESLAPIIGAVTSASFNAWYLQAVTQTARQAYRERFLRRKHGDELLAAYGL
jgi:hypothetical protein